MHCSPLHPFGGGTWCFWGKCVLCGHEESFLLFAPHTAHFYLSSLFLPRPKFRCAMFGKKVSTKYILFIELLLLLAFVRAGLFSLCVI